MSTRPQPFVPELAREAERERCPICGWPLVASVDEGCVPGNCSMRSNGDPDEERRLQVRREAAAAELRHAIAICRAHGRDVVDAGLVQRQDEEIADLREQVDHRSCNAELDECNAKIARLRQQLAEAEQDAANVRTVAQTVVSEDADDLAELRSDLRAAEAANEALFAEAQRLTSELRSLREQLAAWELSARPRLLGIAPDQLAAVRAVLDAVVHCQPHSPDYQRARDQYIAAGMPLKGAP